jgi:hypothetical protein
VSADAGGHFQPGRAQLFGDQTDRLPLLTGELRAAVVGFEPTGQTFAGQTVGAIALGLALVAVGDLSIRGMGEAAKPQCPLDLKASAERLGASSARAGRNLISTARSLRTWAQQRLQCTEEQHLKLVVTVRRRRPVAPGIRTDAPPSTEDRA